MRRVCIEVWRWYDDTYGYSSGKISRIEDIQNVHDNFMYMFAMFDHVNQTKVVLKLKQETKEELRLRMIDGGNTESYIAQIGL